MALAFLNRLALAEVTQLFLRSVHRRHPPTTSNKPFTKFY